MVLDANNIYAGAMSDLEEIYQTSKFSSFPKPMKEVSPPSNPNSKYHSV